MGYNQNNTSLLSKSQMTDVISERKLIDAFKKFEKRKILSRPKPFSQMQKTLYLPEKDIKALAKDLMFQRLGLKSKIKQIFE